MPIRRPKSAQRITPGASLSSEIARALSALAPEVASQTNPATGRPPAAYRYSESLPPDSKLLVEILKATEFDQLFESYYNLIHIPVAIIDLQANVLFSSRWQRICMEFHRVHPETCKRCIQSDTTIAQQLTAGRTYAIYRCLNGLTDCASPIILDGRHVANVFVGEFFTKAPDLEWFRHQAMQFGFNVTDYMDAVRDVPVVAEERIPAILDLLAKMTRVVTSLSIERQRAIDDQAREKVILDTIPQSVFWKDLNGRYLGCNLAFAKIAGLGSPEEIVGKIDFDLPWSRSEAENYRAIDQEVITTKQSKLHFIERSRRSDGTPIVVDTSKVPLIQSGGLVRGLVGVFDDITERKRAEDQLRATEERYRRIVETAQEGIFMFDRGWRLVFANRRFAELLGYTREELLGHPISDIIFESDQKAHTERKAAQAKGTARVYENAYRKKDGEPVWLRVSVSPVIEDGSFLGSFGMVTDITAERQAQARQHESDERLRVAFQTSPDAYVIVGRDDGRILEVNDRMIELYGFTREEMTGRTSVELGMWVFPDDRAKLLKCLDAAGHVENLEIFARRKNGGTFWVSYSVSELHIEGRGLIFGVIHDITETKRAAEKLREAEEHYRGIFENAIEGIFRVSAEGKMLTANPTMARLLGYDSSAQLITELSDMHARLWPTPSDRERVIQQLEPNGEIRNHECQLLKRDGTLIWVLMSVQRVQGADSRPLYYEGFVSDITEKKRLEEQFLRAQRLESIGMLAAGIAHDLNNVLAPINMGVPLLRRGKIDSAELRILDTLESCVKRGSSLVRQILGFAHGVSGTPQIVQVKHLLGDLTEVIVSTFPKSIQLEAFFFA